MLLSFPTLEHIFPLCSAKKEANETKQGQLDLSGAWNVLKIPYTKINTAHSCNRSLHYDIYTGSDKSKLIWLAYTSYPDCVGRGFLWGFVCLFYMWKFVFKSYQPEPL